MKVVKDSIIYQEKIDNDEIVTIYFNLPANVKEGYHELYIDVELYTKPSETMNKDKLTQKFTILKYFDFQFKWMDEKIKYIEIK
jgi:hypothetical protein